MPDRRVGFSLALAMAHLITAPRLCLGRQWGPLFLSSSGVSASPKSLIRCVESVGCGCKREIKTDVSCYDPAGGLGASGRLYHICRQRRPLRRRVQRW